MDTLAIPFLLFVGALLALQAGANVQLSGAMASPIGASALQLTIGAVLLVALAALVGSLGAVGVLHEAEPWHLAGGLGSAVYITAGILLFPRLGAIVTVGLFIGGQMLVSLLLDTGGWLGVAEEPLDLAAVGGAAAVLAAVAMIVRAQAGGQLVENTVRGRWAWVAFAVIGGAVLPIQGAINAQLRADLDAPITVGAWSFIIAAAAMLAVLVVNVAGDRRRPRLDGLAAVPWWGWLGGLCGATYVTSVFLLIPEIGVSATIALTVAGQQLASVFVDRYGLLRLPRRPISRVRLGGVAALLVGVALIQVA
jgi:bacterial/archaeal transporter family-2 protein